MARESRVKKTLLNVRINLICYVVSLVVAFFTRKVLLDTLGTEFMGLTGTLGSLLNFLNMAELGVGGAIGYVLYKPIFNDDHDTINEIVSVLGYLYRWIGGIILGCGFILSLFLPLIFNDTNIPMYAVYAGFYAYLASAMLGYFINYNQSVLAADQRNYIINGYYQATNAIKCILQMAFALYIHSFILYFAIELTFGIVNCLILQWKMRKTYPWLHQKVGNGRSLLKKYSEIGTYTKQLFVHRIGSFVQCQLSPFLIYAFVSLPMVALYGNYQLIAQRVQMLVSAVMGSASAGVGNLIAEGNNEKSYNIFCELMALQMLIGGFVTACIFMLIDDFIIAWLGVKYLLPTTVKVLICIHLFLTILRDTPNSFIFGFGLFYDIWAPIVESILFLIFSILFGSMFGLSGVLMGPIVSLLIIIYGWKPYFLFSKGFHYPVIYFWLKFIRNLAAIAIACAGVYSLYSPIIATLHLQQGWRCWLIESFIFAILAAILLLVAFYVLVPEFRRMALKFIRNKKHIVA